MGSTADLNHFLAIPWCAAIIGDVDTLEYIFPTEEKLPMDTYTSAVLRGNDVIKWIIIFSHRSPKPPRPEYGIFTLHNLKTLIDVGPKVAGWKGVAHGGFTSYLFDAYGGWLGQHNVMVAMKEKKLGPRSGTMTRRLEVDYVAPVPVPSIMLLQAEIVNVDGRRVDIEMTLEDERRMTLARGRLFLSLVSQPGQPSKI
jgi:acyl-coenzyme A thioesterase PaaI-like protein